MPSYHFSRRAFLRGIGVTMALPWMESFNVWGDTRSEVSALAGQVEDALRAVVALQTAIEGAPIATYEPDTKLRGSMQDFSFLY